MVEQTLVVLLIKMALAASLASALVRINAFKRTLLREQRTPWQQVMFALSIVAAFGGAEMVRVVTGGTYRAASIGLEGCLIAGLVGGYVPGLLSGVLIALPLMFHRELLSMPLFAAVGVLGGLVRDASPDPEEIWTVSPFLDMNVYRLFLYWKQQRKAVFYALFLGAIILTEVLRRAGGLLVGEANLFTLYPQTEIAPGLYAAIVLSTMFAVLLPLKIWANARTEVRLAEQQRLLQEARLRALTSQINPHFLFNTLNSVASLVRTNPEMARVVIHKLSAILRRLMRKQDNFTPLRDELTFIEDYLSIEMVRFGDKLRFLKDIAPDTLDLMVPGMILQPIVENSLKHGLASKVNGGTIRLKAKQEDGRLHLQVEDDGVGIPEASLANLFEQGIGISNVNERLQVLYGAEYQMWIDSRPGEGTRTGIEIPIAQPEPNRAPAPKIAKAS